jgi:pSer/pThr/pTyr-binding forkhead associated (FHA) protein
MPIKVFLTVTEGASKGSARDFAKGSLVVGRGKVDLMLFDKKVSNNHCRFVIEGDDCFLEDLNSTNGTFFGGRKLSAKVKLQNLDEVVVGLSKISVAIVEQISEFKKANLGTGKPKEPEVDAEATITEMPEISEELQLTPEEPAEPSAPRITPQAVDPTEFKTEAYRTTAVKRIQDLIEDEMQTFSQWDHPQVVDEGENGGGMIPKVKVSLTKQKGAEGLSNFTCSKPVSTMGRKGVDIKINDLDSSRVHAQIEILGGTRVFIKDLGSTNGTFVNGKRITTQELNSGDLIQIGQTIFEVRIESN